MDLREKIIHHLRQRVDLKANHYWDGKQTINFYNDLNDYEKDIFNDVIQSMIVDGYFIPEVSIHSADLTDLRITQKFIDELYK